MLLFTTWHLRHNSLTKACVCFVQCVLHSLTVYRIFEQFAVLFLSWQWEQHNYQERGMLR